MQKRTIRDEFCKKIKDIEEHYMTRETIKRILQNRFLEKVEEKRANGFDVRPVERDIDGFLRSVDGILYGFDVLDECKKRSDWNYVEPEKWEEIEKELIPPSIKNVKNVDARTRSAFLASVAGCILGKPLECNPTFDTLKETYAPIGEWPITHYITRNMINAFGRKDLDTSTLEGMNGADADDDINYTIIGMLVLEKYGRNFTANDVASIWQKYLPTGFTFGPELTFLRQSSLFGREGGHNYEEDWSRYRCGQNYCGAMIRADAFGYANPGNPYAAAEMAWRDGHMTHEYTGVYGEMFAAAAIASAYSANTPEEIITDGLNCIPAKSRLADCVRTCLNIVKETQDYETAYRMINARYNQYTHCLIYQETGLLINSIMNATSAGNGICLQVMQGCDTDSYCCTCGSILGAYFGSIEDKWIDVFNDRINLAVACAPEFSLAKLADRMTNLRKLK